MEAEISEMLEAKRVYQAPKEVKQAAKSNNI
jgi:hypothetical protein